MKRKVLFLVGLSILVAGGILIYGGVEKADSNLMTCQIHMYGYVYCDNDDPCALAVVRFTDINDEDNKYTDITDANGYFDLGCIKCAGYNADVFCGGDDILICYYINGDQEGCSKESLCSYLGRVQLEGCEISFYTTQDTCPIQ